MNKDQVKGRAKQVTGKTKEVVGKVVDNKTLQVKGVVEKKQASCRLILATLKQK